jgi:hypothetical protein
MSVRLQVPNNGQTKTEARTVINSKARCQDRKSVWARWCTSRDAYLRRREESMVSVVNGAGRNRGNRIPVQICGKVSALVQGVLNDRSTRGVKCCDDGIDVDGVLVRRNVFPAQHNQVVYKLSGRGSLITRNSEAQDDRRTGWHGQRRVESTTKLATNFRRV